MGRLGAAITAVVLGCAVPSAVSWAQRPDLGDFPAIRVQDLPPEQRQWLEHEVMWIITPEEREVFLRLPSDARREIFMQRFWAHRDPTPGTPRNEYREIVEQRLHQADKEFGRTTSRPGRLTDRGHMVVLLGKPRSIERFEGSPVTVPVQVWSYAVDPVLGVPPFFNLLFFRERGIGEYRLYSPLADGPENLLNISGQNEAMTNASGNISGRSTRATAFGDLDSVLKVIGTVDRLLAQVSVNLIPGDPSKIGMAPLRSESLLADLNGIPDRIMPDPSWAYRVLVGDVESDVRFETLPVDAVAVALVDPDGMSYLHLAGRVPGNRINLDEYQGSYYGTYDLTVDVRDDRLRFLVAPESRTVQLELDAETSRRLRSTDVVHMDRLPLASGDFSVGVTIENNVSHEFGRTEARVASVDVPVKTLTSSDALLVAEYTDLADEYDRFGAHYPFQIGRYFMMPALHGPLPPDTTLWVFHQIYAPLAASGQIVATYRVLDGEGDPVADKTSRLDLSRKDRYGVLSQLAGIPLGELAPGNYRLAVDLDRDDRPEQTLTFRVVSAQAYRPPVPHARAHPPANDPGELLARVRQARTLGRSDEAIAILEELLARDPGNTSASDAMIELLDESGKLDRLSQLLSQQLLETPNDRGKLLRLAAVEARRGNSYDAIRYYERARLLGGDDPDLLNGLASAYLAQGKPDKSRQLLSQSLQLDPDQPAVASLLRRIQAAAR